MLRVERTGGWRRVANVDDQVDREGCTGMRSSRLETGGAYNVVEITLYSICSCTLSHVQRYENKARTGGHGSYRDSASKSALSFRSLSNFMTGQAESETHSALIEAPMCQREDAGGMGISWCTDPTSPSEFLFKLGFPKTCQRCNIFQVYMI